MTKPPELNPLVHNRLRLALLALLNGVDAADFTWLREKTAATDGNLGAQLQKLQGAGYISATKRFVNRKPQTRFKITAKGRAALVEYVHSLGQLLELANARQAGPSGDLLALVTDGAR